MGVDQSALATLGLDGDADDAAIERAYRRLIKQHHPDRSGSDGARAAEINRAYGALRANRNLRDPLNFNDADFAPSRERGAWILLAMLLVGCSVYLVYRSAPLEWAPERVQAAGSRPMPTDSSGSGPMDLPLDLAGIDRATAQAAHLRRTSDEMKIAAVSRDCHQMLRRKPTVTQFDRCAAFDDAVVQLQDRDPLRDQGPFSELAVTGRVRSAAALLSDDSVGIDGRLDRIRQRVNLALTTNRPG